MMKVDLVGTSFSHILFAKPQGREGEVQLPFWHEYAPHPIDVRSGIS